MKRHKLQALKQKDVCSNGTSCLSCDNNNCAGCNGGRCGSSGNDSGVGYNEEETTKNESNRCKNCTCNSGNNKIRSSSTLDLPSTPTTQSKTFSTLKPPNKRPSSVSHQKVILPKIPKVNDAVNSIVILSPERPSNKQVCVDGKGNVVEVSNQALLAGVNGQYGVLQGTPIYFSVLPTELPQQQSMLIQQKQKVPHQQSQQIQFQLQEFIKQQQNFTNKPQQNPTNQQHIKLSLPDTKSAVILQKPQLSTQNSISFSIKQPSQIQSFNETQQQNSESTNQSFNTLHSTHKKFNLLDINQKQPTQHKQHTSDGQNQSNFSILDINTFKAARHISLNKDNAIVDDSLNSHANTKDKPFIFIEKLKRALPNINNTNDVLCDAKSQLVNNDQVKSFPHNGSCHKSIINKRNAENNQANCTVINKKNENTLCNSQQGAGLKGLMMRENGNITNIQQQSQNVDATSHKNCFIQPKNQPAQLMVQKMRLQRLKEERAKQKLQHRQQKTLKKFQEIQQKGFEPKRMNKVNLPVSTLLGLKKQQNNKISHHIPPTTSKKRNIQEILTQNKPEYVEKFYVSLNDLSNIIEGSNNQHANELCNSQMNELNTLNNSNCELKNTQKLYGADTTFLQHNEKVNKVAPNSSNGVATYYITDKSVLDVNMVDKNSERSDRVDCLNDVSLSATPESDNANKDRVSGNDSRFHRKRHNSAMPTVSLESVSSQDEINNYIKINKNQTHKRLNDVCQKQVNECRSSENEAAQIALVNDEGNKQGEFSLNTKATNRVLSPSPQVSYSPLPHSLSSPQHDYYGSLTYEKKQQPYNNNFAQHFTLQQLELVSKKKNNNNNHFVVNNENNSNNPNFNKNTVENGSNSFSIKFSKGSISKESLSTNGIKNVKSIKNKIESSKKSTLCKANSNMLKKCEGNNRLLHLKAVTSGHSEPPVLQKLQFNQQKIPFKKFKPNLTNVKESFQTKQDAPNKEELKKQQAINDVFLKDKADEFFRKNKNSELYERLVGTGSNGINAALSGDYNGGEENKPFEMSQSQQKGSQDKGKSEANSLKYNQVYKLMNENHNVTSDNFVATKEKSSCENNAENFNFDNLTLIRNNSFQNIFNAHNKNMYSNDLLVKNEGITSNVNNTNNNSNVNSTTFNGNIEYHIISCDGLEDYNKQFNEFDIDEIFNNTIIFNSNINEVNSNNDNELNVNTDQINASTNNVFNHINGNITEDISNGVNGVEFNKNQNNVENDIDNTTDLVQNGDFNTDSLSRDSIYQEVQKGYNNIENKNSFSLRSQSAPVKHIFQEFFSSFLSEEDKTNDALTLENADRLLFENNKVNLSFENVSKNKGLANETDRNIQLILQNSDAIVNNGSQKEMIANEMVLGENGIKRTIQDEEFFYFQ